MPLLENIAGSAEFLGGMLGAEPLVTLKLQSMLASPEGVSAIHVDNLEQPQAVIVKSGRFHSFFAYDLDCAMAVLGELDWSKPLGFSGVWEPLTQVIAEFAPVEWAEPCNQYYLADDENVLQNLVALTGQAEGQIAVTEENISRILENWPYGDPTSERDRAMVADRLQRGSAACWLQDGEMVSWALTAADHSLGFMHTLDGFRGQGLGRQVAASLAVQVWNTGWTPYCYVVADNGAPRRMLDELGFIEAPDRFVWLGTQARA